MKRLNLFLFIFLFTFLFSDIKAQSYGNEWIKYNQYYYRIKVRKEGIYRISYNALAAAGVPISSVDPRTFQIFNKGEEQYIIVKNENTGTFSTNDYIEFYANKNDGWFDEQLYIIPGSQANKNYSLFNDTATYFLTWNNLISNHRIIVNEATQDFSPYANQPFFYNIVRQDYISTYAYGKTNSLGATDAEYSQGEGWFDAVMPMGGNDPKTFAAPSLYPSGPDATISMAVVGTSETSHHLQITMPGAQIDTIYSGFQNLYFTRQIPASLLNSSANQIIFQSVNNPNSNTDNSAVAYINIKYPQSFNLNSSTAYRMYVPDVASSDSLAYLYINNLSVAASDTTWLYDLTNHKKIKVNTIGSISRVLVHNSVPGGGEKLCYITSTGQFNNVASIMPVTSGLSNYAKFTNYGTPPINNSDYLIVTHKSLMSAVEYYKDYRQSTGYNVLVADIDELYDQFAYGIRKHPLAIRKFAYYAYKKFNVIPKFLFLIGKSLNAVDYRTDASNYAKTLVPTFGVPPSDNLFTSRIIDAFFQPAIPTGRLAAQDTTHVFLYLNKVIDYEIAQQLAQQEPQQNPPLWMKNVLHFGGGGNINEQSLFAGYLSNYKKTIKDTLFGGFVRTFLKTSSAPIVFNQSDSLKKIINDGVSLMTFFGHASGIGFDQSIDNPQEYNNYKKYPFLFANSCYAGDIFSSGWSSSEAFVLIKNKGVIGYLASTALSPSTALNIYAKGFYNNISNVNYGKPVGYCIQQTIKNIQTTDLANPFIKEICLVTVLHGDPAIKINYFDKPDFEVDNSSVFYNPPIVSTEVDSFIVNVISTNLGRAVPGHFFVEVKRTYPNSTITTYLKQVSATLYKDTIAFKLPVDIANGVGINKLQISLDVNNAFQNEITKANNVVTVDLIIKASYIVPVYPAKYAIVPNPNITLKASTGDPFSGTKNYIFQIDTTDDFNSGLLKTQHISHSGGLVTWQLPFTLTDSTVYYWRVGIDNNTPNWRGSSFQYIANKRGWGQAHFFQFKDDTYQYVTYNRLKRNFIFFNNFKLLNVQTGVYPNLPWNEEWFKLNGTVLDIWSCLGDQGNGMKFAVFNPVSGEPWISHKVAYNTGQYGNWHCKDYDVPAFDFITDYPPNSAGWRHKITKFLDTIPNGYYILAYSHINHFAQQYEEDLYQAFEHFGSADIRAIQDNTPYIIFGKKGKPIGTAHEVYGLTDLQTITLTDSIQTKWNQGYVKSELIGPATKWNSLHWRYKPDNNIATDSVRLAVIGVKSNGHQDTILHGVSTDSLDIFNLNNIVNANSYPYLYLIAFMKDDSMHTPAQMKRWQVLYDGVPETCLNPSAYFLFHKDTLKQGDKLMFSCAIQNIGDYNMDSLLVAYWILDKDRNKIPIAYPLQRPHPIGDIFIDTITYPTNNLSGLNTFWVEVNPYSGQLKQNHSQLEQNHINNIGDIPFYVQMDKTNPLLDVTFDGIHILDGDIVSAKPRIQIVLRDENKFLPVTDTTKFKVFLKKPGMTDPERVYFMKNGTWTIEFYPATLPQNTCKLVYPPGLLSDGIYELMVQAKDMSNNTSGYNDFKISFEVINKSTITEVLNYPNPFSTSTRFVFTLTGSEVPTFMKIQIMTITGKIVREIDMTELGNIHIGRNITQYAWDGKDQYGDRLANGVYLYRVMTRMNDKSIDLNQTSASKYFNHEFGKMYLFR